MPVSRSRIAGIQSQPSVAIKVGPSTRIGRLTTEIPGRLETSVDEHALIAETLRRRDPDAAAAALRKHIASVREDQLRMLEERGENLDG